MAASTKYTWNGCVINELLIWLAAKVTSFTLIT
jgi:hypothetical protein